MTRMPRSTVAEVISGEIRAELARQGITQSQLAQRLGWAQTTVSRKLLGQRPLEVDDVEAIATALGVSVQDLGWPHKRRRVS